MAPWHDRMGPAKFRGVPFFVESAEMTGGRKGPVHEYPFKDEPFKEDLGQAARSFPVEGFVLGLEYMAAREALVEALEKFGPGELVHPYYGTRRVAVENYRVRESANEGGVARFSIQFVETPAKPAQPSAIADAKAKMAASAAAASAAVGAEFNAQYSPGTVLSSVTAGLGAASVAMEGVLGTVRMEGQALARLKRAVGVLASDAASLAEVPADLLAAQIEIFEDLADGLIAASSALDPFSPCLAVLSLYSFDPGERPPATTSSRIQERACFDASRYLVQRLAIIYASLIAVEQVFPSYDDAIRTRVAITDLLDAQVELVADDVYPALLQLRADLVKAVPGDALELARLVSHTPAQTVPSLVLAHRLYGNLDLEADVIARNQIRNPVFVRGGVELEVLTNG